MKRNRTIFAAAVIATATVLVLGLAGCKSKPPPKPEPPPPPPPKPALIIVSKDVNPDVAGRPSPIVIRVYQLKEEGAFNSANYYALIDKESETLGASLIWREEYELQPGSTRELQLKIPPEARFLAAVAGYRNLNDSRWKALSPQPEGALIDMARKHVLTINVARSEVTVAAAN
jgi:type VI secretion system protein VasD